MLDVVKKETEGCDCLQSFQLCQAATKSRSEKLETFAMARAVLAVKTGGAESSATLAQSSLLQLSRSVLSLKGRACPNSKLDGLCSSASRTHQGKEGFPGMTITDALIQTVEKIAEKTDGRMLLGNEALYDTCFRTLKLTVQELDIPRTAEELSTLNLQIRLKFLFSVPGIRVLTETLSIDSLNTYIDMTTWPTVFEARLPAFWSVPSKLQARKEVYLEDETSKEEVALVTCHTGKHCR